MQKMMTKADAKELVKVRDPLSGRIDTILLFSAYGGNPNGDPQANNLPRTDLDGYGEVSPVCIKRKLRNRMQDLGLEIFVQSDNRRTDEYDTLKRRADAYIADLKAGAGKKAVITRTQFAQAAMERWADVRAFGQVFAWAGDKKGEGVSIPVTGPVSVRVGRTVDPVEVRAIQITKSTSGDKKEGEVRGSDTMGMYNYITYGLYVVKMSISAELAAKTGFSSGDAEILKECLRTLFVGDASAARPAGSMVVERLYWVEHDCPIGQYNVRDVHNMLSVKRKDDVIVPKSIDDYDIKINALPGLKVDELQGI